MNSKLLKEISSEKTKTTKPSEINKLEAKEKIIRAERFVPKTIVYSVHEVDYTGKQITKDPVRADESVDVDIDNASLDNYVL